MFKYDTSRISKNGKTGFQNFGKIYQLKNSQENLDGRTGEKSVLQNYENFLIHCKIISESFGKFFHGTFLVLDGNFEPETLNLTRGFLIGTGEANAIANIKLRK